MPTGPVRNDVATYYVIEALLAVNPERPEWARVNMTAVTGWEKYRDHPRRARRGVQCVLSSCLAFHDEADARAVWEDISAQKQKYQLRMTHVHEEMSTTVIWVAGDEPRPRTNPFWEE